MERVYDRLQRVMRMEVLSSMAGLPLHTCAFPTYLPLIPDAQSYVGKCLDTPTMLSLAARTGITPMQKPMAIQSHPRSANAQATGPAES